MGRPQQRERNRKKSAKTSQKLDSFLVLKRRKLSSDDESEDSSVMEDLDPLSNLPLHGEPIALSTEQSTSTTELPASDTQADLQVPTTSDQSEISSPITADIGKIVGELSSDDLDNVIRKLTAGEIYTLLKHHSTPPPSHVFPTTYLGGCNRSFLVSWLAEFPWMVYSECVDGAFCVSCVLFCQNRAGKGQFVNKPFRSWHKKSEKCKAHETSQYHQDALCSADSFVRRVESPETTTVAMIDKTRMANIERNRAILKSIVEAIVFCGRQCIALRGDSHTEGMNTEGNPGNFLAVLKLLAKHNAVLDSHFKSPAMRNATYVSPQTQNALLEIVSKHIILRDLVNEIKEAKFFSIMADEVTSHNSEQLALCIRFVDASCDIREEFISFSNVKRITGEHLASEILEILQNLDLQVENVRGQSYDGASCMSSGRVGVQARIREHAPLATYIHCSSHCLNLVISRSCALPEVHNVVQKMQHCCRFFQLSPKRNGLLQLVVQNRLKDHVSQRRAILDLCKTRWAERHIAYQHFYQSFTYIVEALELISFGEHIEDHGVLYADWDTHSRSDAQQILNSITTFDFIVVFLTIYQYLSHLSGITIQLQGTCLDIIEAHSMITSIKAVYHRERSTVDVGFQAIYDQSIRIAEKVAVTPIMPRQAQRQLHRSNVPADSVIEYYQKNVAIPFLDHIISNLENRFSSLGVTASSLLGLVPSVLCNKEPDISAAIKMYQQDLPSPELIPSEILRWKMRFESIPSIKRPSTPSAALKECNPAYFPNIGTLLKLVCTLPVTSCECERSASTLRRLHTYLRASMSQQRLTSLALMHIHYGHSIDFDEVVDIFARLHPRRLELDSLINPSQ
jgi:hypothetical protein